MRSILTILSFIPALTVPVFVMHAQVTTAGAGRWEGAIQTPNQELQVVIDLAPTSDGKKWEGTITIPAQNLKGFPLGDIVVTPGAIAFAMTGVPGSPAFKGTLSKDGQSLSGDFSQGGGSVPFKLTRTGDAKFDPRPKSTVITAELEGNWEGTLDIQGKTLRLVFKLVKQPNGTGGGTIVSVDQGGAEIPLTAVTQKGTHVSLLASSIAGTYEAELKDGVLTGTWTQGPGKFPLVLQRAK